MKEKTHCHRTGALRVFATAYFCAYFRVVDVGQTRQHAKLKLSIYVVLTWRKLNSPPDRRRHDAVMDDVQGRHLIVPFAHHEENRIEELGKLGEVVPPATGRHLETEGGGGRGNKNPRKISDLWVGKGHGTTSFSYPQGHR